MKISIVGNCQSISLQNIIRVALTGKAVVPSIKEVHLIENSYLTDLKENIESSEVVICQLIQDNYRNLPIGTNQIADMMQPNARLVIIPNALFSAYFPSFIYIKDKLGCTITPNNKQYKGFLSDYHDAVLIAAQVLGYKLDDLFDIYHKVKFNPDWFSSNTIQSINNLIEKEKKCDINISNFIFNNYKNRQLFWTYNHPCNDVLYHIINNIFNILGLPEVVFDSEAPEVMDNIVLPIFDFILKSLEFEFQPHVFRLNGHDMKYDKFILDTWLTYDKYPDLIEINKDNVSVQNAIKMLKSI